MTLPLLRRLGTWLASPRQLAAATAVTVGGPLVLQPLEPRGEATFADASALFVTGPEDGQRRAASLSWRGDEPLLSGGTAAAPGFATFLAGDDTVGVAACGLDPAESVLRLRDPDSWGLILATAGLDFAGDLTPTAAADFMDALGGRHLAPWLFALAALLLALELWLGRGAGRTRPAGG